MKQLWRGLWMVVLIAPFAWQPPVWPASTGGRTLVAAFLALLAVVAWPVFRTASTRGQVWWLGFLGSAVLLASALTAADGRAVFAGALAGYVTLGLMVLASLGSSRPMAAAVLALSLAVAPLAAAGAAASWLGWSFSPAAAGGNLLGNGGTGFGTQGTVDRTDRALKALAQIDVSRPVNLSDAAILTISGAPAAAYWSVAKYDDFDGRIWTNPVGEATTVSAGAGETLESLLPPSLSGPAAATEWTVTVRKTGGGSGALPLIYTGNPKELVSLQGAAGVKVEPGLHTLWAPTATSYTLKLAVPSIDAGVLNQAGPAAPAAPPAPPATDLKRDLVVPSGTSPKVAGLARTIAAEATGQGPGAGQSQVGPWAMAQAVSAYLLSHAIYTTQLPLVTGNAVNSFLLDSKSGFCDQFSTSFVVLMRELGVPARWVVGYKVGEEDRGSDQSYTVHASDAHSWAEVYIAAYGWVPIDPTPGGQVAGSYLTPVAATGPNGARTGDGTGSTTGGTVPSPQPTPGNGTSPAGTPQGRAARTTAGLLGIVVAATAGLAAAAVMGRAAVAEVTGRRRRRSKHPGRLTAARAQHLWKDLVRAAPQQRALTPRELLAVVPAEARPAACAAVLLLERVWYGDETVAVADLAAAEKGLRAALAHSLHVSG